MILSNVPASAWAMVAGFAMAGAGVPGLAAPNPQDVKTIVLVHGAWADGSSWDKVAPLLEAKGYHVVALHER